MDQEADNRAAAEIIAAADGPSSPNGFGATVDHGAGITENPLVPVAAAFAGGFVLARLLRRRAS